MSTEFLNGQISAHSAVLVHALYLGPIQSDLYYRTDKTFWRRLFGGRLRQLCRHQLNIKFFSANMLLADPRRRGIGAGGGTLRT